MTEYLVSTEVSAQIGGPATSNPDHIDRDTALRRVGESIEHLLPEEERDKRSKAERAARWAIMVRR